MCTPKRIVTLFLSFAITLFLAVPAFAADVVYRSDADFWTWVGSSGLSWGAMDEIISFVDGNFCEESETGRHYAESYLYERYELDDGTWDWRYRCVCEYCFESFYASAEALAAAYSNYVSTLDSISSDDLTSTATTYLYNGVELPALPEWDKEAYPYAFIGYDVGDDEAYWFIAISDRPSVFTYRGKDYFGFLESSNYRVYCTSETPFSVWGNLNDTVGRFNMLLTKLVWCDFDALREDGTIYLAASDPVPVGGSDITTSTTNDRIGLYMEELDAWNQSHPYQSGQYTPNYYITPDSGNTLYSPAVFSESSMIFTEPVTGTQYPCTKWLYHYTEDNVLTYGGVPIEGDYFGSYILTLTNPVTINGHSCLNYWIVYMDDGVYIAPFYADAADNVYFPTYQFYAYAVVAQTECGIGNHSYTVETLSAPTCGTSGERLYTCSICGDEYVQDIPATGAHSYKYSVSQEPTCAVEGIALYTCSSCGNQYTEPIAVLEHDWLATEVTATTYALPDGTSCPSCAGTAFTHTRNGDIYTCTCSDCGTEWSVNAVITYGSTTYTCSRCGESYVEQDGKGLSEGLGDAIKSFAKKAWSAIASGIGKLFSGFADLLGGIFGFFTETVAGGIKNFFSTLSDDSILGYYQDDTGTATLPEGLTSAMSMIPAFFGGLPAELQAPVIFGIAALFLIAALKLFL